MVGGGPLLMNGDWNELDWSIVDEPMEESFRKVDARVLQELPYIHVGSPRLSGGGASRSLQHVLSPGANAEEEEVIYLHFMYTRFRERDADQVRSFVETGTGQELAELERQVFRPVDHDERIARLTAYSERSAAFFMECLPLVLEHLRATGPR